MSTFGFTWGNNSFIFLEIAIARVVVYFLHFVSKSEFEICAKKFVYIFTGFKIREIAVHWICKKIFKMADKKRGRWVLLTIFLDDLVYRAYFKAF